MSDKVIAILTSDWHLCHTAPTFRSAEPDWYDAMSRPLDEVVNLANQCDCPLVIAGDIFDRYNTTPETVNFAIRHLKLVKRGVYAIPGQHDLPHHRYEDVHKSAYWTLVESGVVTNLPEGKEISCGDVKMFGFPWGARLQPYSGEKCEGVVYLAVVHHYVYLDYRNCFPGASAEDSFVTLRAKLSGFDAVVFGDNHISWMQ